VKLGKFNLPSLSLDELWALHEEVGTTLSKKIAAEKRDLETRLAKLNRGLIGKSAIKRAALRIGNGSRIRRAYPPVLPKSKIRPIPPRLGLAAASNRVGWLPNSRLAGNQVIF
jgi:DNA-binding protein H-NS